MQVVVNALHFLYRFFKQKLVNRYLAIRQRLAPELLLDQQQLRDANCKLFLGNAFWTPVVETMRRCRRDGAPRPRFSWDFEVLIRKERDVTLDEIVDM